MKHYFGETSKIVRLLQRQTLFAGVAVGLAGCGSVSVRSVQTFPPEPAARLPSKIYVEHFSAPAEVLRVSARKGDPNAAGREVQKLLSERLVARLEKHIAPTVSSPSGLPNRVGNAWLVRGRFLRVNQGSRALRAVIGFGLGGSKMETRCEVFDLSGGLSLPFLVIETTGGSNAEPGALFQGDPITGTATIIYASASSGITADASRTARMITAAISSYLAKRGVIPPRDALKPKPLGGFP